MRYYVVSDPHGFHSELTAVLEEKGFFADPEPHKLIICGDLLDRGPEAMFMQDFILDLMKKDLVILIRGNHEDLLLSMLDNWHTESYLSPHHRRNGTLDTVCQLTRSVPKDLLWNDERISKRLKNTPFVQRIIPAMVNYFETPHYIFVHGWIPCTMIREDAFTRSYHYLDAWRDATWEQWGDARWINGINAAHHGVLEPGKTIVCGHFHCSFGHARYEGRGSEFDEDADFSPYYAPGIIALDACTAYSGRINCIVLED